MHTLSTDRSDPAIPADHWQVLLSDGSLLFENRIAYYPSAWIRLKEYLVESGLKIKNLYLCAHGTQIILSDLDGYWQSSRISAIAANGMVDESISRGIGGIDLLNKRINITWISPDGELSFETRDYSPSDQACIV